MASISKTNTRCKSAELLRRQRAAAVDLRRQIEEARHGMNLEDRTMRELLSQLAEAVESYLERICERGTALEALAAAGGIAAAGPCLGGKLRVDDTDALLDAVAAALAAFGDCARKGAGEAALCGDPDTSDMFAELSRLADYDLWLLESLSRTIATRHPDGQWFGPLSRRPAALPRHLRRSATAQRSRYPALLGELRDAMYPIIRNLQ